MNLVQVQMFCLSASLGSASEAARSMDLTQSAVSKGLARLQDEEGVRLLEVNRGRLVLTAAGEALLPIARKLLEQEALASQCLREFRQGETVSIVASESFGIYYLPGFVRRLRSSWPDTRVRVDLAHNAAIEDRVARCAYDAGIVSRPGRNPELVYSHLLDDEIVLVCSDGHELSAVPRDPSDLEGRPFVLHEAGSVPRILAEEFFAMHGLNVQVPLEVSNVETMKAMVREDVGLAFLSLQSVRRELEEGLLGRIELSGERMVRGFYFVHRRERHVSLAMRHLYHTIRSTGPIESDPSLSVLDP